MNTQALHQLYQQAMAMLDQSLSLLHELKTLENQHHKTLTEEEKKKQRRLKAMRWAIIMGISYAGYTFVRKWLKRRREYIKYMKRSRDSGGMMLTNEPMRQQYQHDLNYGSTSRNNGGVSNSYYHGPSDNYYSGSSRYNPGYSYGNRYNNDYGYQPSYSSMGFNSSPDYSSSFPPY